MSDDATLPPLSALQQVMDSQDLPEMRRQLMALGPEARSALEERLGTDEVAHLYASMRRRRRGAALGRVIVLHGIMGSRLAAVGNSGDDRIWLHFIRIALGRFRELRLGPGGEPAGGRAIRLAGMFPEYLPLLAELAERWEVRPFAYDWRMNIDDSADRLEAAIREFSGGGPVHLVAHSMGGLVARRFISRHPATWRSMADGTALTRGGRLVMLGTPNHGSLAIPLVLTGREKLVQMLVALDQRHNERELVDIIGTFGGVYQMLPTPASADDDRAKLFDAANWGSSSVSAELLARARAFQRDIEGVVDPERMRYIAGFDQRTPHRIRVEAPGRFLYQETLDGDGRVPHDLGLLEGVPTLWVRESHGNLPRNRAVLDGIHELMQHGSTSALASQRPVRRSVAEQDAPWQSGDEIEPVPGEILAFAPRVARARSTGSAADGEVMVKAAPGEVERVEALVLRDWVGAPARHDAAKPSMAVSQLSRAGRSDRPTLHVEVWWSDITRVQGDVHAVGHYENVMPQYAELALDEVVSNVSRNETERLVLTNLTRWGILRGRLGDVEFFPWARARREGKLVAVAGMGHPGAFREPELRRLARNLTWAIGSLPDARTVCSVLIGSGAGNLNPDVAARTILLGLADGLELIGKSRTSVRTLRLAELELGRATRLHALVQTLASDPEVTNRLEIVSSPTLHHGSGGSVADEHCMALTLAAIANAQSRGGKSSSAMSSALSKLLAPAERIVNGASRRGTTKTASVHDVLADLRAAGTNEIAGLAGRIVINMHNPTGQSAISDGRLRFTYLRTADAIVASMLTNSAVIPERRIEADPSLLDQAVEQMVDAAPEQAPRLGVSLHRFIVPEDFQLSVGSEHTVIFEVDRAMAKVHWEMMSHDPGAPGGEKPLAIVAPIARQLRTSYSPPPNVAPVSRSRLRALVVGDPGDPRTGEDLPGAQREAFAVSELLTARGVEVTTMIGAASAARTGRLRSVRPARRWDVLQELLEGGYDILHYAGHGDFDPEDPTRVGWVFEDGLLTARELSRVRLAPSLVLANACLSALTSERRARGDRTTALGSETDLLPSLADEFFRRGVRNYVGTAWEVDDSGAVEFARIFYAKLLPASGNGASPSGVGQALLAARKALHDQQVKYGTLWAAYQHYGDPDHSLMQSRATDASAEGRPAAPSQPAEPRQRTTAKKKAKSKRS